jgi:hypothetical protein
MDEQAQAVATALHDWLKQSIDQPKEDVYTELLGYRFKNLQLKSQESIIDVADDEENEIDFTFIYEDVVKL